MTVSSTVFTGKVAVVTGAGSGVGRVTAGAFARAGARVALADLSGDGALALPQFIQALLTSAVPSHLST